MQLVSMAISRCVSHPLRVRGLKLHHSIQARRMLASHPLRVRGLKRGTWHDHRFGERSHPLRVRGLKRVEARAVDDIGAGRTLYGCVD